MSVLSLWSRIVFFFFYHFFFKFSSESITALLPDSFYMLKKVAYLNKLIEKRLERTQFEEARRISLRG